MNRETVLIPLQKYRLTLWKWASMAVRDEFSAPIRKALAERVAYLCSNPICRKLTIGPKSDGLSSVKTGIAAHITAAALGGPRYDPTLTPEERKSISNGVWLCGDCSKLVDSDEARFPADLLQTWRTSTEAEISLRQQNAFPRVSDSTTVVVNSALVSRLADLTSKFADGELEKLRQSWREGDRDGAVNGIKLLKDDAERWSALLPATKAKVVRFEATISLDDGDTPRAKDLANEAHSICPEANDSRLRALIAFVLGDTEQALTILGEQEDIETINLRAALLLHLDKADDAIKLLDSIKSPTAESFRIKSLAHIANKDTAQARLYITKALELEPKWTMILHACAMIDYLSALSPAAIPPPFVAWPQPIDRGLIRRDDISLGRLANAQKIFSQLRSSNLTRSQQVDFADTWLLASLLGHPDTKEKGEEFCKQLLHDKPDHYEALMWAQAYHIEVDFEASIAAIEQLRADKQAEIPHIVALAGSYLLVGKKHEAQKVLLDSKPQFETAGKLNAWTVWKAQVELPDNSPTAGIDTSQESLEDLFNAKTIKLLRESEKTNNWDALVQHLHTGYLSNKDPKVLLTLCELKAQLGDWAFIAKWTDELVKSINTPKALRLSAVALYNSSHHADCLDIIFSNKSFFPRSKVPSDLRRIAIRCQEALGTLSRAVAEAEALATEEPSAEHLFALITLYLSKGDFPSITATARKLLQFSENLTDTQLLQICHWVLNENDNLARDFWRLHRFLTI